MWLVGGFGVVFGGVVVGRGGAYDLAFVDVAGAVEEGVHYGFW